MAKLERYKSKASVVKPVGVVSMSGLREAGRAIEDVGSTLSTQIAEYAIPYAQQKGLEWAQQNRNATPNEIFQKEVLGEYVDPKGARTEFTFQADLIKAREKEDPGFFGNYALEHLNDLRVTDDVNKTKDQIAQASRRFLAEAQDPEAGDDVYLNYGLADAKMKAYLKEQLKVSHPQMEGEIVADILPQWNESIFELRLKNDEHLYNKRLDRNSKVIKEQESAIARYASTFAPDSQYIQAGVMNLVKSWQDRVRLRALDPNLIPEMMDNVNRTILRGQFMQSFDKYNADGLDDEEVSLMTNTIVKDISEGAYAFPGYKYDADAKFLSQEVTSADLWPDAIERKEFADKLGRHLKAANDEWQVKQSHQSAALLDLIKLRSAEVRQAEISGDPERIKMAQVAFDNVLTAIRDSDTDKIGKLVFDHTNAHLRNMEVGRVSEQVKRKGQLETYRGEVRLPQLQAEIDDFKALLGNAEVLRIGKRYGFDSKTVNAIVQELPIDIQLENKERFISKLKALTSGMGKPTEGQKEIASAMREDGLPLSGTKTHGEIVDSLIENTFNSLELDWTPLRAGTEFDHNQGAYVNTGEVEWESTIRIADPYFKKGIIPEKLVRTMHNSFQTGDRDEMLAGFKVYQHMKDLGSLPLSLLEQRLGDDLSRAYNYMHKAYIISEVHPLSEQVFENVLAAYSEKPLMKSWQQLTTEERAVAIAAFDDYRSNLISKDLPGYPRQMEHDLESVFTHYVGLGRDPEEAAELAISVLTEGPTGKFPRWGISDFMYEEEWNKWPVEGAYPLLMQASSEVSLGSPFDRTKLLRTILKGHLDSAYIVDADGSQYRGPWLLPGDDAALVGEEGTNVRLQIHRRGTMEENGGRPIYKALAVTEDETLQGNFITYALLMDEATGRPKEIDLSGDEQLESDRLAALSEVDSHIEKIEAGIGSIGAGGDPRPDKTGDRTWQDTHYLTNILRPELEEDLVAMQDIRNRLIFHKGIAREIAPITGKKLDVLVNEIMTYTDQLPAEEKAVFHSKPPIEQLKDAIQSETLTWPTTFNELIGNERQEIPDEDREKYKDHYESWKTSREFSGLEVKDFDWYYWNIWKPANR